MTRRQIRVVGAMLERGEGRYLITQRKPTASLPLLWEFPGGRVDPGETDATALARELKERLAIDVVVDGEAHGAVHEYPDYDVDHRVLHCRLKDPAQQISHDRIHDHRWVTPAELSNYEFPGADARTVSKLLGLDG